MIRPLLKKSLALLLPLSLLAMGIACVCVCLEHEAEEQQLRALFSAEEKGCAGVEVCCPMAKIPDAALCERASVKSKTCNAGQPNILLTLNITNQIKELSVFHVVQAAASPPCQRASVLRI